MYSKYKTARVVSWMIIVLLVGLFYSFEGKENVGKDVQSYLVYGLIFVLPVLSLLRVFVVKASWFSFYAMTVASWLLYVFGISGVGASRVVDTAVLPIVALVLLGGLIYHVLGIRRRFVQINQDPMQLLTDLKTSLGSFMGEGVLREILFSEIKMYYYCFYVWFRKPVIRRDVITITYHRKSMMKVLLLFGIIMLLIDFTVVHTLISLFSKTLAWVITILGIYTTFYIIAFYNSARYAPHMIDGENITVRQGLAWEGRFPAELICSMEQYKVNHGAPGKPPKGTFKCVLGLDDPQYEIELKEPIYITGIYGTQEKVNKIQLWVDQPDELYRAIRRLTDRKEDQ